MATIAISARLALTDSGVAVAVGSASASITQAGAQSIANVQIVGTATEALLLGDVTTTGYLYVENLDETNYVQIGLNTPVVDADAFIRLLPGEFALVPTRQTAIYAIAHTAAVNLRVLAVEL